MNNLLRDVGHAAIDCLLIPAATTASVLLTISALDPPTTDTTEAFGHVAMASGRTIHVSTEYQSNRSLLREQPRRRDALAEE